MHPENAVNYYTDHKVTYMKSICLIVNRGSKYKCL